MKVPALASVLALGLTISAAAQDRSNTLGNGVAPMATTDPQIMIYRVAGVHNTYEPDNDGSSTVFSCYNNSSVYETLRLRIIYRDGVLASDDSINMSPKRTLTLSTHNSAAFIEDLYLATGQLIMQGTAAIISTSKEIFCSAMIVDAAASVPSGIALHMVRYNPAPGTVE